MGEVYRAEDTNLSRDVAIKVLPEQFTQDPQRLARFEREAKLLASLNHPNIAAIHSFEHADGIHFLVLKLVPGETLGERVAKGPLPVKEVLDICRQIAEGVEAAHEKGVIHRDLKPANMKVTPEGRVKILDFGLAKAFEAETPVTDMSQSPTLTEEMTRAGVILGTAAYMSPEQARGEEVDKRADIFAFGCVLYELLTAKRTFDGKTLTETLAKILEAEPDWETLPATTPWRIQELLRRCLTKDANDRLRDIANVRVEIKLALTEPSTVSPLGATPVGQTPLWKRAIPWSITAVVILIAGVALWNLTRPALSPSTMVTISLPPTAPLATLPGIEIAISPNGRRVVFLAEIEGRTQLYRRFMDELEAVPIPGTEGAISPFFSPDGESVAFFADEELKKVSLMGGAAITLCDVFVPRRGDWLGETIVFAVGGTGLYRVSSAGGTPESLAVPNRDKGETNYHHPQILPGGRAVLFSVLLETGNSNLAVLSLESKEPQVLLEGALRPRYAPSGHLLYETVEGGVLMARPFDLEALQLTGGGVPVLEGFRYDPLSSGDWTFSPNGTLLYIPGEQEAERRSWLTETVKNRHHLSRSHSTIHAILGFHPTGSGWHSRQAHRVQVISGSTISLAGHPTP